MRETPLTAVIVNVVAIVRHAVRYANESHKIQLTLGVWHRGVASFGRSTSHNVATALSAVRRSKCQRSSFLLLQKIYTLVG